MKHLLISGIALSAVLLSGCARDEALFDTARQTVITADIESDGEESRTAIDPGTYDNGSYLGVLWTAGDSIGVFGAAQTRNSRFNNVSAYSSKQTDFSGSMTGGEEPLYAYYPWTSENAGRSVNELRGTLSGEQPFSLATGLLSDDWKWGVPRKSTTDGTTTNARFTFLHLFSLVKISIDASGVSNIQDERLDYIDIASVDNKAVAGSFSFDASTGSYTLDSEGLSKVRMRWTDTPLLSADASYTGFVTLFPDNLKAGSKLQITVATESHRATFNVELTTDFEAGKAYNFPLLLSNFMDEAHGWSVSTRPVISSFGFNAADNQGKILDKKLKCTTATGLLGSTSYSFSKVESENATVGTSDIDICIPYLYDFRLKPVFTVADGLEVRVNGEKQTSGVSEQDFSKPVVYELVNAEGESRRYKVNVSNSGLPVVVINQSADGDFSEVKDGTIIKRVRNKFVDFMVRGKETDWVETDKIAVYEPDGTVSLDALGGVRLRGNSTQKYPKKPLAIKLAKKASVLGMPTSKRWVLLANWIDHSLIRNAAGFAIANTITAAVGAEGLEPGILWNPHGRNVELIIDGRHVGNYLLAEQIKIEGNRLDITDSYEDVIAQNPSPTLADCGFLIELDQSYDEISKFRSSKSNLPVQFKDEMISGNSTLWTALQSKINGIDNNLTAGDYTAAYADYDIYSAIDQMIVYELVQNREYTEPRSVYYYIDRGGKLTAGPVWDFDRGTFHNPEKAKAMGNETNRIKPYDQWLFQFSEGNSGTTPGVWYRSLIKDPTFKAALKARWTVLKPYLEAYIPAEIERLYRENSVSWTYNDTMWPTSKAVRKAGNDGNEFKDWSGDEEFATYDEVIQNMITCYSNRLAGVDALIKAL